MIGALISAAGGFAAAGKQKKMSKSAAAQADALNKKMMGYADQNMDLSKGFLGEARSIYNARMAGAGQMENNINQNQANTMSNLQKNSTDSSSMLALAGAAQGMSNDAFNNLALNEAQDKQQRYGNVQQAQAGLQESVGNMQNIYGQQSAQAQQSANQLMNASMTNKQNAWNGIGEGLDKTIMAAANIMTGGLAGGGGGGQQPSSIAATGFQYLPQNPTINLGMPQAPNFLMPQQSRFTPNNSMTRLK